MATIHALENNKWQLSGEGISVTYGFTPEGGINLCEFHVLSENGNASYCKKESSLVPIVNSDTCTENERPPFFWKLRAVEFGEKTYHKRPVQQLDIVIEALLYKLTFHAIIFPGVPVIKQWWECENTSIARTNGFTLKPLDVEFSYADHKRSYWLSTFGGGHTRPTQGDCITRMLGGAQKYSFKSHMSAQYAPWFTVCAEEAPYDGIMVAMDYMGDWTLDIHCNSITSYLVTYVADGGRQMELFPKCKIELPAITFAAFHGRHDDLMQTLYDWQYRYMFDATSDKYFAATKSMGPNNVAQTISTETYTHRPSKFDLENTIFAQQIGANGIWSDCGWDVAPEFSPGHIFFNTLEGADLRDSIKYCEKTGLGYTLWFCGSKIPDGVMSSKGSWWGDFEWRTDGFNMRNQREFLIAKDHIEHFTSASPDRAFHSCNGGGTYMHNFEIQRLTSYNYTSDGNASPYLNYYFSFFELPDKQSDEMEWCGGDGIKYNGASTIGHFFDPAPTDRAINTDHRFARLPNIPGSGMYSDKQVFPVENYPLSRELFAIYEYMKRKGVAGRFCYCFHPRVYGDKEYYYRLRTSPDKTKAVLIISRGCNSKITVFPDGLLPDLEYEYIFQSTGERFTAMGRELLEDGITIRNPNCSDLIWFNLPDYPFGGSSPAPKAPIAVYKREENNIKTRGVGIYIAAEDDEGKYYYSIRRNGEEVMKLAIGSFWFDFSPEAHIDAEYTVCTVGFDEKETVVLTAQPIAYRPAALSTAGSYSTEVDSFRGFSCECSDDGKTYRPAKRIPCPGTATCDLGGFTNRDGGLEGWFEASGNARIGRGWQQAGDTYTARVYTADRDQTVRVTGNVMRNLFHNDVQHPVRVNIYKNEEKLWTAYFPGGQNISRQHDLTVELKQGDKLRFVTDKTQMPRALIYPTTPTESGAPHPTEPVDKDAAVMSWVPLITDLTPRTYESGLLAISADGNDGCFGGSRFTGQKLKVVDGALSLDLDAKALRNDLMLVFDSDDLYMDEGYVTIKVNGKTYYKGFDVVREKGRSTAPVQKFCKGVLAPNGSIHVEITMSGGAKLKYLAMAPANEFRSFHVLGQEKYIDWAGDVWTKPVIRGGKPITTDQTVEQTFPTLYDAPMYQTARAGQNFEAELDVPDGIYSLRVLTSNAWSFDGKAPEFAVYINGQRVETEFNTAEFADNLPIGIALRYEGILPENGKIRVCFKATGRTPAVITAIAVD